jgi:hypothetical protein
VEISRVNNPAVLNAIADTATIREPAAPAASTIGTRAKITGELMALALLVMLFTFPTSAKILAPRS